MLGFLNQLVKNTVLAVINLYQRTISPDHGWGRVFFPQLGCRYYPSCSEYMKKSIIKHGLLTGTYLGLCRLARCHPLSLGGYDPVRE